MYQSEALLVQFEPYYLIRGAADVSIDCRCSNLHYFPPNTLYCYISNFVSLFLFIAGAGHDSHIFFPVGSV